MKSIILFGFATLLTLASAMANDSEKIVSIGRNNIDSASIFNSVLHLVKKDEVDSGKYYELSCKKSRLSLLVVNGDESSMLLAQMEVQDCKKIIRDVYDIAYSETLSADFVISDTPNKKGVFDLDLSYSTKKR